MAHNPDTTSKVTIYIPNALAQRLQGLSEKTDQSVSAMSAELIEIYLDSYIAQKRTQFEALARDLHSPIAANPVIA